MKMTLLSLTQDINGYNTYGLPYSNEKYIALLAQSVISSLTVPSNIRAEYSKVLAVFSFEPGSSVFVGINESPIVPVLGTFVSSTGEQNPSARYVQSGDVINFITAGTSSQVGVIFYAVR